MPGRQAAAAAAWPQCTLRRVCVGVCVCAVRPSVRPHACLLICCLQQAHVELDRSERLTQHASELKGQLAGAAPTSPRCPGQEGLLDRKAAALLR